MSRNRETLVASETRVRTTTAAGKTVLVVEGSEVDGQFVVRALPVGFVGDCARTWHRPIMGKLGRRLRAASSVLGLILLVPWQGPAGVLVVWSTSIAADVVFVVGSIAAAVAGVTVAKSTKGSIALAAVITWLTYSIAAEIALRAFSTLTEGASAAPDNFPSFGMVLLDAPLLGFAGVAFAAVAPALLRQRVKRLLKADPVENDR